MTIVPTTAQTRFCRGIGNWARKGPPAGRVEIVEGGIANFAPIYTDGMQLFENVETIAKRIYRADQVLADNKTRNHLF